MTLRLQRRLETLYGLERRKDKLGLEGTRALLAALGDPHRRFRSVHVAGTNGKGSVCALVERVLRESGHRTGLYTSPHLVDFRERIRVDGRWVEEDWIEDALDRIEGLPEGRDRTFFEVATVLGFMYFAERGVEIAVVEVGLGGRLDCTNVITPEICVITSIGLDHTEILGDTLEAIAAEKAGIVKPNVPVVCESGPRSRRVIEEVARARGAPWVETDAHDASRPPGLRAREGRVDADGITLTLERSPWGTLEARSGLRGRHQLENLRTALATLAVLAASHPTIDARSIVEGIARARWPGRLEPCPTRPGLWWDGAHNVEGVESVLTAWEHDLRLDPPAAIVLALSRDKDVPLVCREIARRFPRTTLVATRTSNARALEPEAIRHAATAFGLVAEASTTLHEAIDRALERAGGAPVLLTGSLFAVGEAMELLGGAPGERS